jgi:hypothetical protein
MQDLHALTWLAVKGKAAVTVCTDLGLRAGMAVTRAGRFALEGAASDAGDLLLDPLFEIPIETVRNAAGYRPDEPSPAFDGRFMRLEAIDPTLMQRLFGG